MLRAEWTCSGFYAGSLDIHAEVFENQTFSVNGKMSEISKDTVGCPLLTGIRANKIIVLQFS